MGFKKFTTYTRTVYQRMVDVDMLNAVKSMLGYVSSVSPSSEQKQPTVGVHMKLRYEFKSELPIPSSSQP